MKRILYVDFENVSSAGLNGMSDLTTDDEVKIFLGPKCSKMSLIEADNIFHGDATVELIKNDQIAKNALDFIIMVHLGYDVAKKAGDLFFIISNDKGYDPAIHEMQVMTGETIARYQDIAQVIKRHDAKPGLLARLFGKKKADETTDATANATEHEVIKRGRSNKNTGNSGSRNGSYRSDGGRSNRSESNHGSNENRNGGNGRNGSHNGNRSGNNGGRNNSGNGANAYGNGRTGNGNGSRNNNRRNGSNRNTDAGSSANTVQNISGRKDVTTEQRTVVRATVLKDEATKPVVVTQQAVIAAVPKPQPVMSPEDDYLDGMSIAELRAKLKDDTKDSAKNSRKNNNSTNVEQMPTAPNKDATPTKNLDATASSKKKADSGISSSAHRSHGRMKTVLTDSEKALVDRAVAETDNLGDFHNYILKELHDNDRATEIYKSEKHRVKIVRPEKKAEKNGSEKVAGEKPATEAQNQSVENTENVIS